MALLMLPQQRQYKKRLYERLGKKQARRFLNKANNYITVADKRAWKLGIDGEIWVYDWLIFLEECDYKCLCCGSTESISIDHVVPLSRGGTHSIENAQPLCKSCNSRKGTKIVDYRNRVFHSITKSGEKWTCAT